MLLLKMLDISVMNTYLPRIIPQQIIDTISLPLIKGVITYEKTHIKDVPNTSTIFHNFAYFDILSINEPINPIKIPKKKPTIHSFRYCIGLFSIFNPKG